MKIKLDIFDRLIPADVLCLIARFAMASVFWRSVQTKISGGDFLGFAWQFYNITPTTFMLFSEEYKVPLFPPTLATYMATFSEFFLSLALVIGFATRLSALGLLGMTAVIQIFVLPDGWPTHVLWATGLLYLIKTGGGRFSIDKLIFK